MTGLKDFFSTVEDFKKVTKLAVTGGALTACITWLSGLSPAWPPGVDILGPVLVLISIVFIYHLFYEKNQHVIGRTIVASITCFVTSLLLYIYVIIRFSFIHPISESRHYMGCDWSENAKKILSEYGATLDNSCPGEYHLILESANFESLIIWTSSSIDLIKFLSVIVWFAVLISFSFSITAFVLSLSKKGT